MSVFQIGPECVRAQVVNDLREQELQTIKHTCDSAARRIVVQNYRDLAVILNKVGRK